MRSDVVTLGDLAGRIAMLEVACSRCGRRGRLRVDLFGVKQHACGSSLPTRPLV
jgi:hypothetical protein